MPANEEAAATTVVTLPKSAPVTRRNTTTTRDPNTRDTRDVMIRAHEPDGMSHTGPIYEDIDRNCTYRGQPPPLHPTAQQHEQQTYYNVVPFVESTRPEFGPRSEQIPECPSSSDTSYGSSSNRPPTPSRKGCGSTVPTASIYYYSDTLRVGQVAPARPGLPSRTAMVVDSDSGISSVMDTPSPNHFVHKQPAHHSSNRHQLGQVFELGERVRLSE